MYRFSSFLGWDSRVSRILANEKPLFQNSPSIAPCFKMAEKESESEGETIETGWSVSTSRVLIQFYSENPLSFFPLRPTASLKTRLLTPCGNPPFCFLGIRPTRLDFCRPIPRFGPLVCTVHANSPVACSRLSVVGDERKRARKKRGRTQARSDGRACKTFFNDPLLV